MLSKYRQAVHGYLRLIELKSLPKYYVTNPEIRSFSKNEQQIERRSMVKVMFKLVELIEGKIKKD